MSSSMKLESNKEIYSHHLHDRNMALARAHQSCSTSLDVLGIVTRWKVGNLEKKINVIWPLLRPMGLRSAWVQCKFMLHQERPQPAPLSTGCTLECCLCWAVKRHHRPPASPGQLCLRSDVGPCPMLSSGSSYQLKTKYNKRWTKRWDTQWECNADNISEST